MNRPNLLTDDAPAAANPFLQGNFAPVREEVTADELTVIGKLPPEMDGMFVRNGPNPQFPPIKNYHVFEGDGMLHGLRIRGGRASYRNRYIRAATDTELVQGSPPDEEHGQHGPRLSRRPAAGPLGGGEPHEIQVPGLDTAGPYTYGGKLRHQFTAHPKVDPATGEMLFFGYSLFKPSVRYGAVSARGEIAGLTTIDIPRPVVMHEHRSARRAANFTNG